VLTDRDSPHDPAAPADVSKAYDRAADKWLASRPATLYRTVARLLDTKLADLPAGARALDVGCGAGVPITRELVQRGFRCTGLDFSRELLAIARREVPSATYVFGDMRTVSSSALDAPFDLIVAWDSIFHVPRVDHALVFARFAEWLAPHGKILLSLGVSGGEFTSEMLGETFWYSGYEPEESARLLERAGLSVLHSEIDDPQSRGHLAIVAEKRGRPENVATGR
jgi:cyclopropane fatty-acyl-phospholipid synthase-like methyltransferase